MRKYGLWALLALILALLAGVLPARAAAAEDGFQEEPIVDVEELKRAAEDSGSEVDYGLSLDEGIEALLDTGSREIHGVIRRAVRSGVVLLAILLLVGLADAAGDSLGQKGAIAVTLAGTLAVTAAAVADVNSLMGMGAGALDDMRSFANVLLPAVAAVTAATGAVTGAAARQMAAVLFSDILINLIDGLLVPVLYGYIAASAAWAAVGNEGLKRLAALLKWLVVTVLTVVMLTFVGYLTASGVIAGTADAASVKAAKFAISGAIPVVGGILSEAAETVLASAGILRGTVGVFGMVTVLAICLVPALELAVHYLAYKLVAALASAVGQGRVHSLVEQLGGAFGLILGMTGSCCLLLLIALVSSISVAAV